MSPLDLALLAAKLEKVIDELNRQLSELGLTVERWEFIKGWRSLKLIFLLRTEKGINFIKRVKLPIGKLKRQKPEEVARYILKKMGIKVKKRKEQPGGEAGLPFM